MKRPSSWPVLLGSTAHGQPSTVGSPRSTVVRDRVTLAAGGLIGGLFFLWISGLRVVSPTQFRWVMQLDWRIHFLGWHFFRHEPWHWPPGRIEGYFAPAGTAIGFTDSIPLVALLLKPVAALLPPSFQYLGLWLLVCFILQGFFGVLILRLWTPSRMLQLLGAAFFVLMPTLLIRVGHPSLCAHWLLLWALWLYFRGARDKPWESVARVNNKITGTVPKITGTVPFQAAGLGLVAGLIHPYLAVMTLAILSALAVKDASARASGGLAAAVVACFSGWWMGGLFTVSGPENLASDGLGYFSLNLLSPITPSGWSTLLPELPTSSPGQAYEGFQYFGAGALVLIACATVIALREPARLPWRQLWPLVAVTFLCAAYALSPRIALGEWVLVDATSRELSRFAFFRATGRYFWPLAYLILVSALALVLSRLSTRVSGAVLAATLMLQAVDLSGAHGQRRVTSRSEAFHTWQNPLSSPAWHDALPHYDHLVLYPPRQCASAPIGFEAPAYLAGLYGLTINSAEVARFDERARSAYCADLGRTLTQGVVDDRTMYLMDSLSARRFRATAQTPLVCGPIDVVTVCVSRASYQPWRDAAVLAE